VCPRIEFECIIQPWHQRLGVGAHSLVLVLEVKVATTNEPKIKYEGIFEGNETVVLIWSTIPGVGHYCWLRGPMLQVKVERKANFLLTLCIVS
jgi:hypothetical protein